MRTDLLRLAKDMVLLAAMRAAIAVLAIVGRQLSLSKQERQALLARVSAAILPGTTAG